MADSGPSSRLPAPYQGFADERSILDFMYFFEAATMRWASNEGASKARRFQELAGCLSPRVLLDLRLHGWTLADHADSTTLRAALEKLYDRPKISEDIAEDSLRSEVSRPGQSAADWAARVLELGVLAKEDRPAKLAHHFLRGLPREVAIGADFNGAADKSVLELIPVVTRAMERWNLSQQAPPAAQHTAAISQAPESSRWPKHGRNSFASKQKRGRGRSPTDFRKENRGPRVQNSGNAGPERMVFADTARRKDILKSSASHGSPTKAMESIHRRKVPPSMQSQLPRRRDSLG